MDARSLKVFVAAFAASFLALVAAWVAVDLLSNLDELLSAAGPEAAPGRALRRYFGIVGARGVELLGFLAAASILPAFVLARVAARRRGPVA